MMELEHLTRTLDKNQQLAFRTGHAQQMYVNSIQSRNQRRNNSNNSITITYCSVTNTMLIQIRSFSPSGYLDQFLPSFL